MNGIWRRIQIFRIVLITLCVSSFSCSSAKSTNPAGHPSDCELVRAGDAGVRRVRKNGAPVPEGWIDNDTFQVVTFGYAPKGVSSRAVRENVSLDMARRYAKSRIGQGLWGYLCEINAACDDYIYPCCSGPNAKNAIAEAAASGSVILVRYDSDSNCGIIVRAVQKNLKDRIGGYHEK